MLMGTESGSYYEIDLGHRKIRRLQGVTPTTRIGTGEWRLYLELHPHNPTIGQPLIIVWDINTGGALAHTTVTSLITSIEDYVAN